MANEIEQLITNFLVPDSEVIKENTIKLKQALKDPEFISKLCYLISSSSNVMVRQYGCVILRNRIFKRELYKSIRPDHINLIQETLMKSMIHENEKIVLSMACNVMAYIIKHKLEQGPWPEFFDDLNKLIICLDYRQRERGCFILQEILTPFNSLHFVTRHMYPTYKLTFDIVFADNSPMNLQSSYHIGKCLIDLLPSFTETEVKLIDKWGENIMNLIKLFVQSDEEKASELVEYFMIMIECDCIDNSAILNKYTDIFIQMLNTPNLPDALKIKAAYFIRSMVVDKKKVLLKYKLIERIIDTIIPLFAKKNEEDEFDDDFYEEENYQGSLLGSVTDLMEEIAINITPAKFMPYLLKKVETLVGPCGDSFENYRQRGAYLILASVVPGCPLYIKMKYLDVLVRSVLNGVKSQHPVVQKAAFYALSYFADSLQPEIISYHEEIMPLLYDRVSKYSAALTQASIQESHGENIPNNKEEIESCLIKAFTAFETFIENMDKFILEAYLPTIVTNMVEILKNPLLPVKLKEFSISALSATASAAEELMQPYLSEIINILEKYLVDSDVNQQVEHTGKLSETQRLQIQSIDALNMFSRCLNRSKSIFFPNQSNPFESFSRKCLEYSINTLNSKTDPDLKSVIYGLIGGISDIMKGEMVPYLGALLPHFSESLLSTNEMMQTKGGKNEKDALIKLFDMIQKTPNGDANEEMCEDTEPSDSEAEDDDNCAVENVYIEEKENALLHLGEIASSLGQSFIPYLQPLYAQVLPMIYHTYLDVQCEAIKCLAQFCSCFASAVPLDSSSPQASTADKSAIFAYNLMATDCLNKFIEICKDDENKDVVCACLESINQIMKDTLKKRSLLTNCNYLDAVVTLVKRAVRKKMKCQIESSISEDDDHHEKNDEDDEDTETDALLMQTAYECVPTLCNLLGPEMFATNPQYLPFFMNDFSKKLILNSTGKQYVDGGTSVTERSFLLGLIADLVSEIPTESNFEGKKHIIETFYRLISDSLNRSNLSHLLCPNTIEDTSGTAEILSNAVFAIGCLFYTNPWLIMDDTKYPIVKFKLEQILEKFISAPPSTRLSPDEQMLCDNCTAAFARIGNVLILNNQRIEDIEEITDFILRNIPLKRDQTENLTVYKYLANLLGFQNQTLLKPNRAALLIQGTIFAIIKGKVEGDAENYLKQIFVNTWQAPSFRTHFEGVYQQLNDQHKAMIEPLLSQMS